MVCVRESLKQRITRAGAHQVTRRRVRRNMYTHMQCDQDKQRGERKHTFPTVSHIAQCPLSFMTHRKVRRTCAKRHTHRNLASLRLPKRHAPISAPFSIRHTLSSVSFCAASCLSRMAADKPAGPPPTTSTSNSMASRGACNSSCMDSSMEAAVEEEEEKGRRGRAKGRVRAVRARVKGRNMGEGGKENESERRKKRARGCVNRVCGKIQEISV